MKRAIIVGSGACGSTVARLLARSGQYTVLVLEKGRNHFTGLGGDTAAVGNEFANDELGWEVRLDPTAQDPLLEPRSFRTSPADGARSFVGDVNTLPTTVGGGTVHYDAKARRFREVDFETNTLLGGNADQPAIPGTSYADWPMQYRHLEPFYAVMEEVVGVQGPAHGPTCGDVVNPNPNESYRSTPFPMPPGVPMYSNLLQADAAARLGHHPAAVPTAVNSRPYRDRPACVDCAHCLNFGCPINAKGGGVWQLQDALRTGLVELRSEADVIRVEVDAAPGASGRHRARGVTYLDADGAVHTELGDLVVLANTPIEATRLSLLSGIGVRNPDESNLGAPQAGAAEPSGMLGRNLMFHLESVVVGIFNREIHPWRGRTSTHTLDDFAGAGPRAADFDPTVPRAGVVEMGGNIDPINEATQMASFAYGVRHTELMQLSPFRKHLAAFTMQGEDMPQLTNYVDIDPTIVDVWGQPVPRVTYRNHPYEVAAAAHYLPRLLDIMQAVGGPGSPYPDVHTIFAAPLSNTEPTIIPGSIVGGVEGVTGPFPFSTIPRSAHIMGTHRMAFDREHGPCTPYGRYWAFDNLYHAGGGLFVTAPGYNVTLTMWALSYWVAAAILTGVDGGEAYDTGAIDGAWPRLLDVIRVLDGDTMIARVLGGGCRPRGGTLAATTSASAGTARSLPDTAPGGVSATAATLLGSAATAAIARRRRARAEDAGGPR